MKATFQEVMVLGSPVHVTCDYVGWLLDRFQSGRGTRVVTLNAEMAIRAEQDVALHAAIQQSELVIPDGAGVSLYLKARGYPARRCPGIELAEATIARLASLSPSEGRSPSIWLYGGKPGVTQQAAVHWHQRYPHLNFSGIYHGYLTRDEQAVMMDAMAKHQPSLILSGLGVPRQELWMLECFHHCPHSIWIGVGGSFDIWSGTKERAPEWFCNNNLEWLYRLYQEPWRWRRMLALPKFAWRAFLEWLSLVGKFRKT